jgi:hypothetical protein
MPCRTSGVCAGGPYAREQRDRWQPHEEGHQRRRAQAPLCGHGAAHQAKAALPGEYGNTFRLMSRRPSGNWLGAARHSSSRHTYRTSACAHRTEAASFLVHCLLRELLYRCRSDIEGTVLHRMLHPTAHVRLCNASRGASTEMCGLRLPPPCNLRRTSRPAGWTA